MLIVIDQRRVLRAATEDFGFDEVPERGADNVGVGETILELRIGLDQPVMLDRIEDHQDQGKDLDKREHRTRRHPQVRLAAPIQMMPSAEYPTEEDQDRLEIDRSLGGPNGARDEFHLAATAQNLRKLVILIPMPAPTSAT
jgi:hypothetical protein